MLRDGATLQYAVYSGTPDDHTRFPASGFITGDVRNLVEFVRPAAEPTDMISQAADDLADGADRAANAIVDAAALDTKVGVNIAEKLRQPWPKGKSENPQQAKADQEARRQTANMATGEALDDIGRLNRVFEVLEDGPRVTEALVTLCRDVEVGGRQVHDANIVATMLAHGERRLLTFNGADFRRYEQRIELVTA